MTSLKALTRFFVQHGDQPTSRGKTVILLVEDDTPVRLLVQAMLERAGYFVHGFEDPRSALAFAHANGAGFDLVLTDIVLPDMSGRALLHRLTELQPDAPVLYMSGYSPEMIQSHGLLEPGTWFLPKPFTTAELLETVRTVLDGDAVQQSPVPTP